MYGQTNAWALPDGDYAAFRGLDNEIYVMTDRSALNLSFQVGVGWDWVGGGVGGQLPPVCLSISGLISCSLSVQGMRAVHQCRPHCPLFNVVV